MTKQDALFKFLLRLGDQAFIQGHRLSEWCSKAPLLEEDLALTNMALDYIGRSQAILKYAGEIEAKGRTEDDLVYKRAERDFYNPLISELPNGDFAYTIAKQLFISIYEKLVFDALSGSKDEIVSSISKKTIKEVKYHFVHARDWCYRLGLGTDLSHDKMQKAVNQIWMYTGDLFDVEAEDLLLLKEGIGLDLNSIKENWLAEVKQVFVHANINVPTVDYMQSGSKKGIHTEYLGYVLSEVQYLQRAYPDAKW